MTTPEPTPHNEFSDKYDPEHARQYLEKHESGFWRRLSTWREEEHAYALRVPTA